MRVVAAHLHATWTLAGRPPEVRLGVRGELDLATTPRVREALDRYVAGAPGMVTCDLTQVGFADSQVVHWLLSLHRERRRAGGALVVAVRPGGVVERLLALVGADEELRVVAEHAGARGRRAIRPAERSPRRV